VIQEPSRGFLKHMQGRDIVDLAHESARQGLLDSLLPVNAAPSPERVIVNETSENDWSRRGV
jgi:hypothetical protein